MLFRSDFEKGMIRDLYGYYLDTYQQLNPVYPQIFETREIGDGEGSYVQDTSLIGMGELTRRKEGDKIIESNPMEGYTVYGSPRTFSDSTGVTMEMNADTPKEKIANILRDLAKTWATGEIVSKEKYAANIFNYGGYLAGHDVFIAENSPGQALYGQLIYDGKPFFALSGNNHPSKNGGTYYNSLALALSDTNIQTAWTQATVTNAYDERDQKIALMPDTLLIPPNLRFTARKILESTNILGSANNDINVAQGILNPIEWAYLTDTDAWFVGKAKAGIVFLERMNGQIDFWQDQTTKKYYASIDSRFGAYVKNWRYWVGSQLSTS